MPMCVPLLPDTWRGQFSTSLQAVVVLGFRDGLDPLLKTGCIERTTTLRGVQGCQDVEKKSREASSKPDCSSLYCICFGFRQLSSERSIVKISPETFAARVHF